ncbi:MAG: DNA repair protein RecO [Calothrix sp. MO_192.B10]|nr:DNA repair protein RecO [Calothrix sp. MO_192.B10]
MGKTYKVTGINLKTQVFGESDRIVTILTQELGLIRVIAPGARKHLSSLGGRSGMFVVNELLISKGRSLDRITQAQTIKSYPGLAQDLGKLAASQYLAEIALLQALSEQPQVELYELLNVHLHRLQGLSKDESPIIPAYLAHGIFQLLAFAGFTPQIQACCLTHRPLIPEFNNPHWRVGFSINSGGTICLQAWENLKAQASKQMAKVAMETGGNYAATSANKPTSLDYETILHLPEIPKLSHHLNAQQLATFQQLLQPEIILENITKNDSWLFVEKVLRQYVQHHFGRPIRSAALIDSYFAPKL